MNTNDHQHHRDFLRLYTAHEAVIFGFVRSLLPRREDAREVMQEVAVILWEKFSEFDQSRDFRKWACGIARYEVLAWLRDHARERLLFDEALVNLLAQEAIEETAGESRRAALENCLQKLETPHKDLVLTAYAPGARIDLLAEKRGQTAMSLYKVLHRIRQTLLDCVERTLAAEGSL
ncbi:MAG: sigma-70 family RNA polymerase sigma factor [Planctomycetaceae bacterium]